MIEPTPTEIDKTAEKPSAEGFLTIFGTTFLTVFIAEFGDKTQVATLLLSAESGKPFMVFIGSALALICSSLIGVLLGRWLSNTVPTKFFEYSAGGLMIALAIWLGGEAIYSIISDIGIN